jgi:hypothetical protein
MYQEMKICLLKNIYNNPDNDWKAHTLTTYGVTNCHKYSDIAI